MPWLLRNSLIVFEIICFLIRRLNKLIIPGNLQMLPAYNFTSIIPTFSPFLFFKRNIICSDISCMKDQESSLLKYGTSSFLIFESYHVWVIYKRIISDSQRTPQSVPHSKNPNPSPWIQPSVYLFFIVAMRNEYKAWDITPPMLTQPQSGNCPHPNDSSDRICRVDRERTTACVYMCDFICVVYLSIIPSFTLFKNCWNKVL